MKQKLKILHLEDLPTDSEMVSRELKKADVLFEKMLVDSKEDFTTALKEFKPDIILSDHSLPVFDSHEALKIVKEMGIHVPFILVTATVSEEYAVNIIKNGASDYILKDRLQRLPNAVLNAIAQFDREEEKQKTIEALQQSEQKYKVLFENNPMPMWIASESLAITDVNEAAINHYGYTRLEFLRLNARDLWPEENINIFNKQAGQSITNRYGIRRHKKKDGSIIMVEMIANNIIYKGQPSRLVLANDITEKLKAEAELANQQAMQQKLITEITIQAQEKERNELGRELHDNISQILSTAKMYLGMVKSGQNVSEDLVEKSYGHVTEAMAEIRKLSHTLVAPSLGDIGLKLALEELIEDTNLHNGLQARLVVDEKFHEKDIDKTKELMLYRIVQEQLNNITKHAKAKESVITLKTGNGNLFLSVADNGVGFDTSQKSKGIGLKNISSRVAFYSGNMNIISAPGQGCTLEVLIPC